jgi:hypothetical protein
LEIEYGPKPALFGTVKLKHALEIFSLQDLKNIFCLQHWMTRGDKRGWGAVLFFVIIGQRLKMIAELLGWEEEARGVRALASSLHPEHSLCFLKVIFPNCYDCHAMLD